MQYSVLELRCILCYSISSARLSVATDRQRTVDFHAGVRTGFGWSVIIMLFYSILGRGDLIFGTYNNTHTHTHKHTLCVHLSPHPPHALTDLTIHQKCITDTPKSVLYKIQGRKVYFATEHTIRFGRCILFNTDQFRSTRFES